MSRPLGSIEIKERLFWFYKRRRTIPFHFVEYIDTRYEGEQAAFRQHERRGPLRDYVIVSLVLKGTREKVDLADFASIRESGEFVPPKIAYLTNWSSATDRTDCEVPSHDALLNHLQSVLQVSVGPRFLESTSLDGAVYYCPQCGHIASAAWARCIYCGGALSQSERQAGLVEGA